MPSLLAHLFLGMLLAYIFGLKKKSILLFASILPDIKIFLYVIATPLLGLSAANALIVPIHSPFGSLLMAVFFASVLPEKKFQKNLLLLSAGAASHYALDASIYPFYGIEHYLLAYPFSWNTYGIEASSYIYAFSITGILFLSALLLAERKGGNIKTAVQ